MGFARIVQPEYCQGWPKSLNSCGLSDSRRPAQALPIRRVVAILAALGAVTLVSQFVGMRHIHGIVFLVGVLLILLTLLRHALTDNSRATYRKVRYLRILLLAVILWLPFALLLVPGVVAAVFIDGKIEEAVLLAETKLAGTVERVETQIEDRVVEIEAVDKAWWWPPDWFKAGTREVEKSVLRKVQKDVLRPAPAGVRIVFSLLYAVMRISQLMLYTTLGFIVIRSFVFILGRAALLNRAEIEFSLP